MLDKNQDEFNRKVHQQIERLKTHTCREIEAAVALKRITWVRQNLSPAGMGVVTPRRAFELLFFEYMGLQSNDLPIVSEDETQITWRSLNPCPTLEACRQLDLDTRRVCRDAYEKSTQAFLSELDPQLRFLRSYSEIRPYADYCLERIVRLDYAGLMRIAIEEAEISLQEGNHGYGAVAVLGEQMLGRAHDTVFTAGDASLHAEVNALRLAMQRLGEINLSGVVLISTCEPCPMCSSLAVWSNVSAIVYGAGIAETAARGKARIRISANEVVAASPVRIEVIGSVLKEQCLLLYQ